jgi:hypothetical protein
MPDYSNNPRYWLERRAKQKKVRLPVATVAFYGPDHSRASKVVVSIMPRLSGPPRELKKWFSDTADLRYDATVLAEMLAYMDEQDAQKVVMLNRIMGCPHESGIDYPEGFACPQCPYWADKNRFEGASLIQ